MRLKPVFKASLIILSIFVWALLGLWIINGIRLGIWTPIEYERYFWLRENLTITQPLWHHEINAGDNVEDIINKWKPRMISRFGSWVELRWNPGTNGIGFIGVCIIGKDGKVVTASSYSDDGVLNRMFVNTVTPAEESEYEAAFKAYVDKLTIKSQSSINTNGLGGR